MFPLSSLAHVHHSPDDPPGGPPPAAPPAAPPPGDPPPSAPPAATPPGPSEPPKVFDEDYVKQLRGENAQWRTKFQEQKKLTDAQVEAWKSLGSTLGLTDPTQPPDPAKLQEEVSAQKRENRELRLSSALDKAAAKYGADPDLLIPVLAHQRVLDGLDPTSATFAKDLNDVVKAAVDKNPKLKASQVPGRSGAEFPPGNPSVPQLTRDQLKGMTWQQIEEARQKGQLDQLLGRAG